MAGDKVLGGRAFGRVFGAVVVLDDGTQVVASNGLNLRVPPNSRVGVVKMGSRYVLIHRER